MDATYNTSLPNPSTLPNSSAGMTVSKINNWFCSYIGYPILQGFTLTNLGSASFGEHDLNMANAMAKMLIYLIENGLITNDA